MTSRLARSPRRTCSAALDRVMGDTTLPAQPKPVQDRIDEGGLPSTAVRFTADHGVAMRPKLKEEGSPMESYVGLDVHSKRSVFVTEAEDGRVVGRGDVPTTPAGFRQLRQQHELAAETPVALETGTVAFYAARELARVGLRPVVIDAHEVRVKAHRPRQKSDRRDAFELCEGLRRGHYRAIVHVPPAPIGALRETLSRRRHFVAVRVAEVNAVKRLLRAAGLGHLSKSLGTDAAWEKLLAALATEPALRTYVAQHHALWRCAQEQIVALEETLAAQPATIAKVAARLQTVPGVGPIGSLNAGAVYLDGNRVPGAKYATRLVRLEPYNVLSRELVKQR